MAVSVATGNKQHRGGNDARHEQRVMISAADHREKSPLAFSAALRKNLYDCGGPSGRRSGVQKLGVNRSLSSCRYLTRRVLHCLHHTITPAKVGITNINAEANPARNTVDCTRKNLTNADG